MFPLDSSPDSDSIRFWFRLGLSVRFLLGLRQVEDVSCAKADENDGQRWKRVGLRLCFFSLIL